MRRVEDVRRLLNAGPTRSRSTRRPCRTRSSSRPPAAAIGAQCIVVAIDARRRQGDDPRPAGRSTRTADARRPALTRSTGRAVSPQLGAGEILLTSMDRDGTRQGFDLELTRAVVDAVPVPVIASGGVGTLQHLADGVTLGGSRRGAGGLDLPLRRVHGAGGQGVHGRAGRARCGCDEPIQRNHTRMARRGRFDVDGPRAGHRAGRRLGPRADGRLGQSRSAGRDRGAPAGGVLVALARPAVAQGRGVGSHAAAWPRSDSTATAMSCCTLSSRLAASPATPGARAVSSGASATATGRRSTRCCRIPNSSTANERRHPQVNSPPSSNRAVAAIPTRPMSHGCLTRGEDAILKKIGEEATETVMAAKDGSPERIIAETADLWFHCLIMLAHYRLAPRAGAGRNWRAAPARQGSRKRPRARRTSASAASLTASGRHRAGGSQ